MIRKCLKCLGWLLLVILILLLILAAVFYFAIGTDRGLSFASNEASKRIEGLSLNEVEGNILSGGIQMESLHYSNESINVNATGIDSSWKLRCAMQKKVCVETLRIDELNVDVLATSEKSEDPKEPLTLPELKLPVDATFDDLVVNKLRVTLPDDSVHEINDIHLSATATNRGIDINDLSASYQDKTAKISGSLTPSGDYPLDIDVSLTADDILPDELPEGSGNQALSVNAKLSNTVRNLNLSADTDGVFKTTLTGSIQPLATNYPLNVRLKSPSIGWPVTSNTIVSASHTDLAISGSLQDYQVTLFTRLEGEQIPVSTVQLTGLVNTERALIPAIGVDTLNGTATGQASVSFKDLIDWNTQWNFQQLDTSVYRADMSGVLDGALKAKGSVDAGNWSLDLEGANIKGDLQGYPFDLDIIASKSLDNNWNIEKAILNNGRNSINALGSLNDTWDVNIDASLPELNKLLPDLNGDLIGNIKLSGALEKPNIDLNATAASFTYQDIKISGISLKADIKELLHDNSDINLAIGSVVSGENTIRNGRFGLSGSRGEHVVTLFADGPQATAIDLTATGTLAESLDWEGQLDKVDLEVPAHKIKLNKATRVSWNHANKKVSADPHCWVTEGSNLCLLDALNSDSAGNMRVSLDEYSLTRLNPFLPAQTTLAGKLTLNSDISWGDNGVGSFNTRTRANVSKGGVQVRDPNGNTVSFTYDKLDIDTQTTPSNVSADISLSSQNLGEAVIDITMDPFGEEKPINGSVKLERFDIGVVKAFLPDFDVIAGTLNAQGDISGRLSDPRFDGSIEIEEPEIRADLLPLPITGGSLVTTVKGKRAFIDGELDSNDGSVVLEGSANWRELDAWAAQVDIRANNLNVQSDPLQQSSVNSDIGINASPGNIQITGDVSIPSAVIDVEELPQGAARVSSDVIIIEDEDVNDDQQSQTPAPSQASSPSDTKLTVNVDVSLGDDIALSAYGLTANLTGDVSIRQRSPNPPQLGGEIQVLDGIYKQYGQNLAATGQILFVGPVNQTRLAIDAVRTISEEDDRIAGLRIGGTVEEPKTELFTEPSDKQQDAILSYIVLGRDINDDTSNQEANLLAAAALALTVKGGNTIGTGVASALGVSDFALETRGRGDDTELVVSGRLNDRLLVRYGRSVFQPQSTLYLRYDLSRKLYIEAAQSLEGAVDVFYSFSF